MNIKRKILVVEILVILFVPFTFVESKEPAVPTVLQILRETIEETKHLRKGLQLQLLPEMAVLQGMAKDVVSARATLGQAQAMILNARKERNDNEMLRLVPALLEIAIAQGKLQDAQGQAVTLKQATSLVETSSDERKKLSAIGAIALAHIRAGDVPSAMQALSWANRLVKQSRHETLGGLMVQFQLNMARTLVDYGQPQQAIRLIREVLAKNNNFSQSRFDHSFYKEWGRVLAKTKDLKELQEFVKKWRETKVSFPPTHPGEDLLDFLWLSEMFLDAGDKKTASQYLSLALEGAKENKAFALPLIEDPTRLVEGLYSTSAMIWSRIAILEARLGNLARAFEAETQIPLGWYRGKSFPYIAEKQLRNGNFAGAQWTAEKSEPDSLAKIIVAQANYGDVKGAVLSYEKLASMLDSDYAFQQHLAYFNTTEQHPDFLNALRAVSKARVTSGDDFKETVKWARNRPTPDRKVYALLGVAEGRLKN